MALESTADAAALAEFGRKVAMHVAASRPQWPQRADVPTEAIAATRAELEEVAQRSGKPQAVVDKMVEGRLQKFFADVVLDEQPFVFDLDVTVGAAQAEAERAVGASIRVAAFIRFGAGDGINKPTGEAADALTGKP